MVVAACCKQILASAVSQIVFDNTTNYDYNTYLHQLLLPCSTTGSCHMSWTFDSTVRTHQSERKLS